MPYGVNLRQVYILEKSPNVVSITQTSPKPRKNREKNTKITDKIIQIINSNLTIPPGKTSNTQEAITGCVAAASCKASISGYARYHTGLPSHTTCLNILHNLDMDEMVRQATSMLIQAGKDVFCRGKTYTFAIDKTQDPYYGKHDHEPGSYTIGGQRKKSTNYFFTYLTMSIVDQGRHLTIFSIPWAKGMQNLTAIQQCIELIDQFGLKIRCLCLDREFYSGEIFRDLQEKHVPHIVPVKVSGTELKAMLKGRKSKTFRYTQNQQSDTPTELVITDCVVYQKGKNGKYGLEHHAFVVSGISSSPRNIREIYRHRFAIESTYRLRNTTRPKTTTKDPKIRFFYTLISFLIQNCWISLKWNCCAKVQRGPKVIDDDRVTLAYFVEIIQHELFNWFRLKEIEDIVIS